MNRPGFPLLVVCFLTLVVPAQAQQFGGAVALADDDILVGETRNRAFPGVVYVFQHADGTWNEASRLQATEEADRFGSALAGDGSTLLIGASGTHGGVGATYVYHKNAAGAWVETAHLMAGDADDGDAFGSNVALDGDVALISAPGSGDGAGAVYVFRRNTDGAWTQQARLISSDGAAEDGFGAALALDGDVALIGAPAHNESTGAVYVFRRGMDGTWMETGRLPTDAVEAGNRFGSALALRDGLALVSAPRYDQRAGAVFAFAYDAKNDGWTPETRLAPFQSERFAQFGASMAFHGDDVWIGTPGGNRFTGAVYAFQRDGATGAWTSATRVTGQDLAPRSGFGGALVARNGLAVVGALGVDSGEGAAIVLEHDASTGTWMQTATLIDEASGYASIVGETVPCADDEAAGFGCSNVDLVSFLSVRDLGGDRGVRVNDIWGWTDPETGREYALVGRTDGTAFVDVTDPHHPIFLGNLAMTEGANASVWRDIKVYKDHAFIVADGAGNHGMQVFDLTRLRSVANPPVEFTETAHYGEIFSAHNIVINEDTGFAYSVGSSSGGETCGGGLHMINIQDPTQPTFAGCFADPTTGRRKTGYSHDAQCVVYHGPDAAYQGKEICFGSNETALSIADVTDKNNPKSISMATYPKVAYTHQGWLTDDHRYFYMNDEGDEPQGLVEGTRTLIWDVTDLDDPLLAKEYIARTTSTDHNLYIKGNLMYQSNYDSGFRVLDITDPVNPVEVGYFDTVPYEGGGGGSWSNYPYFKSGVIVVTSMGEGLFVLQKKEVDI